jgi:hypothetical protein
MSTLDRTNAFIVLNGLPNIGPITLRLLLDAFQGDPVSICLMRSLSLGR